jgi:hypothetical protein
MDFCGKCGKPLERLIAPSWTFRYRCPSEKCGVRFEVIRGDGMGGDYNNIITMLSTSFEEEKLYTNTYISYSTALAT